MQKFGGYQQMMAAPARFVQRVKLILMAESQAAEAARKKAEFEAQIRR